MVVFVPEAAGRLYPSAAYGKGAMRVKEMLENGEIDIHNAAHIAEYYRRLFRDARTTRN